MPQIEISWDIMKYADKRDRYLKEGEVVFKAGHIIVCELDDNCQYVQ